MDVEPRRKRRFKMEVPNRIQGDTLNVIQIIVFKLISLVLKPSARCRVVKVILINKNRCTNYSHFFGLIVVTLLRIKRKRFGSSFVMKYLPFCLSRVIDYE